jgi:hypothetical protein
MFSFPTVINYRNGKKCFHSPVIKLQQRKKMFSFPTVINYRNGKNVFIPHGDQITAMEKSVFTNQKIKIIGEFLLR